MKIIEDSSKRPALFSWRGKVPEQELLDWMSQKNTALPKDLVSLWAYTGGGDFFESETLLFPFGDPALGDDIGSVNLLHRSHGMPAELVVFHQGFQGLTAIDLNSGQYVVLDLQYRKITSFNSVDDWYGSVRSEFQERYSL